MARQKGSQKYGGRKPGTPNRTTEQIRNLIQIFIEKNWNRIQKDFDSMKPSERLTFLNSLLRHVLPDPISLDKLSENQLSQLHDYFVKKYENEPEKN
jgi:hypothetical protein